MLVHGQSISMTFCKCLLFGATLSRYEAHSLHAIGGTVVYLLTTRKGRTMSTRPASTII